MNEILYGGPDMTLIFRGIQEQLKTINEKYDNIVNKVDNIEKHVCGLFDKINILADPIDEYIKTKETKLKDNKDNKDNKGISDEDLLEIFNLSKSLEVNKDFIDHDF